MHVRADIATFITAAARRGHIHACPDFRWCSTAVQLSSLANSQEVCDVRGTLAVIPIT